MSSSRKFKSAIQKFDGDFPVSHLKLSINNDIGNNIYGITLTPYKFITEVQINENGLSNLSDLGAATTLAHEIIHAYLNGVYFSYSGFENLSFRDKMRIYANDNGFSDMNLFQHNFMGQYIDAMTISLHGWDKQYGTGGNLGWSYYKSMVYSGMFQVDQNGNIVNEIDTFKILVPNAADRQAIANIILSEQNGNNDAKGTKCD